MTITKGACTRIYNTSECSCDQLLCTLVCSFRHNPRSVYTYPSDFSTQLLFDLSSLFGIVNLMMSRCCGARCHHIVQ